MTQFGGRDGGRGAEQQCRKRGGSSKDGGVTPLKVKQLYYHINSGRFTLTARLHITPEITHSSVSCYDVCNVKVSFCGAEYERTLLFSFGMAAVFRSVFFFSSANI